MEDEQSEWDDEKARSNLAKHEVSFETASRVFADPGLLDETDDTMSYDEERYKAVGLVDGRALTVIYILRGKRIRIISARKSTAREQADYVRQNPPE